LAEFFELIEPIEGKKNLYNWLILKVKPRASMFLVEWGRENSTPAASTILLFKIKKN